MARAQDFETAAKHFSAAQEAFGRKHFKVAASEFQAAYDITRDPILLFNIGESCEKAGQGKKAAAAYRSYLKLQPEAQDRAVVQKRVRGIEAKKYKLASQSAPGDVVPELAAAPPPVPEKPPAAVPPQPPPAPVTAAPAAKLGDRMMQPDFNAPAPARPAPAPEATPAPVAKAQIGLLDDRPASRLKVAAWVGVAATVAVLTAGAIFGLAAQSRADEISRRFTFVDTTGQPRAFDMTQMNDYRNLKNEGQLYDGLAIGFFSAAGALAVATTVMFVVDYRRGTQVGTPRALTFAPAVSRDSAGVAAAWRF